MIRIVQFVLFMASIGWCDTINSASKNLSIAVYGIQRLPTDIIITAGGGGAEPGTYAYFNSWTCPTGWVEANGANGTVDLRGVFVRTLDKGRGMDPDATWRAQGSYQGDAIRNITGTAAYARGSALWNVSGAFYVAGNAGTGANGSGSNQILGLDASRVVPTGSDNRPKNVALLACMKQ